MALRMKATTTQTRRTRKAPTGPRSAGRLQKAMDDAARREIDAAMRETGGNMSEAARVLGVHRVSLFNRMKSLGIAPDTYR